VCHGRLEQAVSGANSMSTGLCETNMSEGRGDDRRMCFYDRVVPGWCTTAESRNRDGWAAQAAL
jgi:hypothetical protein